MVERTGSSPFASGLAIACGHRRERLPVGGSQARDVVAQAREAEDVPVVLGYGIVVCSRILIGRVAVAVIGRTSFVIGSASGETEVDERPVAAE